MWPWKVLWAILFFAVRRELFNYCCFMRLWIWLNIVCKSLAVSIARLKVLCDASTRPVVNMPINPFLLLILIKQFMYSISRLGSNAFSTTILTTSSSLSESLTSLVCFNAVTDALNAIQSGARLKNFWQLQSIAPCMHLGIFIYDHVGLLAFMTWFFFGRRSGRCC